MKRAQAELDIRELLRASAFPHEVGDIELRETHISWVVLTGSFAYKIKKPVKLSFLDASTLQLRRHFCEEEVRLNRRLAPELYLDVVSIGRRAGHAMVGSSEPAIEYAVRMRQFSRVDELTVLLAHGEMNAAQIGALGRLLAQFHSHAAVAEPARTPERTAQICDLVLANLTELAAQLSSSGRAAGPEVNRLADWTHTTMRSLRSTFHLREQRGFIREGHGDLHAANVVRWHGQLVPFDCIEFDPKLRWLDVMDDVAFLVMDLASRERADLAFALLSNYLEATGDYEGVQVLPFYAVYRALVRAKVSALRVAEDAARGEDFDRHTPRYLTAATGWSSPRRAAIILMHGLSGSGKSWLSERLVPELRAVRIRSDLERKRLAGIEAAQSARAGIREGIYSPEFNRRAYERLAAYAQSCLRAGLNVIVDASFLQRADRERMRDVAADLGAPCVILSCRADRMTLAARLRERSKASNDPSDATLPVLDAQLRENHALDTSEDRFAIVIDTTRANAVTRAAREVHALLQQQRTYSRHPRS